MNRTFGLVGEFGGQFRSSTAAHPLQETLQYRFGPRFNLRSGDGVTMFTHGMIGGTTNYGGFGEGAAFTLGAGGGLEIPATDRFTVRVFQFDYIPRLVSGDWQQGFRFGAGLVIH